MIIGECPYCDGPIFTPIGPAPCYSKEVCPHCKKTYWLKHSRLEPIAIPFEDIKETDLTKLMIEEEIK